MANNGNNSYNKNRNGTRNGSNRGGNYPGTRNSSTRGYYGNDYYYDAPAKSNNHLALIIIFTIVFVVAVTYAVTSLVLGTWNPRDWHTEWQAHYAQVQEDNTDETSDSITASRSATKVATVSTYSSTLNLEELDIPSLSATSKYYTWTGGISVANIPFSVECNIGGYEDSFFTDNLLIKARSCIDNDTGETKTFYAAVFVPPKIDNYKFVSGNKSYFRIYDPDGGLVKETGAYFTLAGSRDYYYSNYFSGGGNRQVVLKLVYEYNPKKEVPLPDDPVKEGYTFMGWYYDEAFTNPYAGEPIYEDTQLYARFEINCCTVTFMVDGSVYTTITVDYGTAFSELLNIASQSYLNVLNITTDNTLSVTGGIVLDDSVIINATKMSNTNKALAFITTNKWCALICIACGIVISAAIVVVYCCLNETRKRGY